MNRNIKTIVISLLAWVVIPKALAGSISAELSQTEMAVGEGIMLSVVIQGSHDDEPEVKAPNGLLIERRGVSQSMSIVNGSMSREKQISYVLSGETPGDYEIPAIKLEIDGKVESTLPLRVKVTGSGQTPNGGGKTPAQAQGPSGEQKFGIFIRRTCPEGDFYPGEAIVCQVRIYHKGHLRAAQRVTQPSPGIRRFTPEGEKSGQQNVNGETYAYIEVPEVYVADSPGIIKLPPFGIDARFVVRGRGRDAMGELLRQFGGGMSFDMGFAEEKQARITSKEDEIKVLPLPGHNNAKDLLIGNFNAKVDATPTKVRVGDTVTISVKIEGEGLLDGLSDLGLDLSGYGKIYPDKPTLSEKVSPSGEIHSEKVFKFVLVPNKAGNLSIQDLKLSQYNPKSKAVTDLVISFPALTVEASDQNITPLQVGGEGGDVASVKSEVKLSNTGKLPIFREPAPLNLDRSWAIILTLFLSNGLILLSLGLAPYLKFKRKESPLTRFSKNLEQGSTYRAFQTYLGEKLGSGQSVVTRPEILQSFGSSPLLNDLLTLFDELERQEYAKGSQTSDMRVLKNRALELVTKLEGTK